MKRKIVGARERKLYVYIKMVYIGFVDKKISKCNHLIHLSLLFICAYVIYHVPSEKHLYKSVFVFNSSHSFFGWFSLKIRPSTTSIPGHFVEWARACRLDSMTMAVATDNHLQVIAWNDHFCNLRQWLIHAMMADDDPGAINLTYWAVALENRRQNRDKILDQTDWTYWDLAANLLPMVCFVSLNRLLGHYRRHHYHCLRYHRRYLHLMQKKQEHSQNWGIHGFFTSFSLSLLSTVLCVPFCNISSRVSVHLPGLSSLSLCSLFDRPLFDDDPLLFVCAPKPIVSNSIGGPLMHPFRNCSKFKLLPYLPRTYINSELYGMPNRRDAWLVVIFLFQTWCSASVNSAFVHERGGPPRGAECWPLGRLTKIKSKR